MIIEVRSNFKILKSTYVLQLILNFTMMMFVSGCITLGKDFPEANVSTISIGVTTKK